MSVIYQYTDLFLSVIESDLTDLVRNSYNATTSLTLLNHSTQLHVFLSSLSPPPLFPLHRPFLPPLFSLPSWDKTNRLHSRCASLQTTKQIQQKKKKRHSVFLYSGKESVDQSGTSFTSVQSLDRSGRRGGHEGPFSRDPLLTSGGPCEQFGMGRDVLSLTLSIQHLLCRPRRRPPSRVPRRKVLDRLSWPVLCPKNCLASVL